MTVLAYIRTPEGFVVGADGCVWNKDTGKSEKHDKKKLIRLEGPGVNLICGWAGATGIRFGNGQSFDLTDQTERIGRVLLGKRLGEQFVKTLSKELRRSCAAEVARLLSKKDRISALLVGYVGNRALYWVWQLAFDSLPQEHDCIAASFRSQRSP